MAQIETWYKQDIKKAVQVQYINGNLFSQDNQGNIVGVEVYDNGEPVTLSGTVNGNFIRADGGTVAITGASEGNRAYVVIPQSAYAVPGTFALAVKLTDDSVVTTLLAVAGTVYRSTTDSAIDPGTIIPSIETLIAQIEAAVESIPADYSSLWETLAPNYSDITFPVLKGQYCTYNGVFYRAKQDIPTSESWTSSHWTAADIGVDLADIRAKSFTLLSGNAIAIAAGSDLNDYTTPGNYSVANASVASNVSHYPFSVGGRIIVLQTTTTNTILQIIMANSNGAIKCRLKTQADGWSDWDTIATIGGLTNVALMANGLLSSAGITDLDDIGVNTIYGYVASDIPNLSNFPALSKGGLIITLNQANISNGRIQFVVEWSNGFSMAMRYYQDGRWSAWGANGNAVTTITCGTGKDFTNLVDCLDYVTSDDLRNTWSENNQLVIQLEAETYSMDKIATLYGEDSTRYKWGVYIPRCCTIKGRGKDRTIITYDYSGSDDWILGHLSPFNMPYESGMEDLSITAKNCRYCVHSDGDEPFSRTWALSDAKITLRNVRMEHQGYSAGNDPTYKVPAAWGAGMRNNCVREFINCEFIAKHMPWFTHDSVGNTRPSEIIFKNCKFINNRDDATFNVPAQYACATFISWGTVAKNTVSFYNCYSNRYTSIRASTAYDEDTTCDYFVYDDGDNMIVEDATNNAHLLDTWVNRNCLQTVAGASITGYTPVSVSLDGIASAYSSSSYRHGIAVNSASTSGSVTVQVSGLIDLRRLGISGFTAGQKVGYSSGWVEDNDHPIILVLSGYYGQII